jgi:hypothetical protein
MIRRIDLTDFKGGWVIGDFSPTLFSTKEIEVACKKYQTGAVENRHYHKIATEITIITEGSAFMNDVLYMAGSIVTIPPGESSDFRVVEGPCNTTVIKIPSVIGDKYLGFGPGDGPH